MRLFSKGFLNNASRDRGIGCIPNSLEAINRLPKGVMKDVYKAVDLARRFNDEIVKPVYRKIDRIVMEDNDYLPLDFVKKSNDWGLFTCWIPKMFGGKGMNFLSLNIFMEELSTVCPGLANVIGVHYLGISVLCATGNIRIMTKILREVVRENKKGNPSLISLAWTEPEAGTDQGEGLLLDRARLCTKARKTNDGYVVNGRKIFISAGHLCTWHMLVCYEDVKKPTESLLILAAKTGMKGFTFGHKEKKMGQKACVASELIFDDCFIPDSLVCSSPELNRGLKASPRDINLMMLELFPAVSRAGVAAVGTGVARGAYETALEYAKNKIVHGERLINYQWAQLILAEMCKNVVSARALYFESALTNILKSALVNMLFKKSMFYFNAIMPAWFFKIFVAPFFNLHITGKIYKNMMFDPKKREDGEIATALGAIAKFATSDISIENSRLAMELMGGDGTRHDFGAEKYLRDGKLLQIYEGTNELCRMHLFRSAIAGRDDNVKILL